MPVSLLTQDLHGIILGITVCLMIYKQLAWTTEENRFTRLFYALRAFALEQAEARGIIRAID